MFYSLICLVILSAITHSSYGTNPNWLGSFNISPLCDRQVCCCLSGQVQVTEFAHFFMKISGNLAGQCDGRTTFSLPTAKPSGYSTKIPIVGVANLSEDSSTLTVQSPLGSQCNGRAIRQQ